MVRMTSERILLIGDAQRQVQTAVVQAMPAAQVVAVSNYFDAIAELTSRPYTAVLAAAEPIERRPESAVRTLRELAGNGRVLLFGHPTLEPLSRKMLEFGIDDYLVTPATAAEIQQMFVVPPMRLAPTAPATTPTASSETNETTPIEEPPATVASPSRISQLLGVPLADVLLDALLHTPNDAPGAAVNAVNGYIAPTMKLTYTPFGATNASPPAVPEGSILLTQPVRVSAEESGAMHLVLPRDEDETTARHFLAQLAHLVAKVVDLQDRHNRLQKLAITDELTGLYNGRYFRHFLKIIVEKARSLRFPVTLLLFDIDNFKKYNDQYGHGVGDDILRQTAALMKRCVRDHDLVARISGDEFAVVFWEKEGPRQPRNPAESQPVPTPGGRTPQAPQQILERFRKLLATQNFPGLGPGGQGTLTISGGLAVFPYDASNVAQLIDTADRALMFKAKQSGKNSIYLVGGGQAGTGDAGSEAR
jgi:PleD family two-component response regulator